MDQCQGGSCWKWISSGKLCSRKELPDYLAAEKMLKGKSE